MLLDLASPWCAALEGADPDRLCTLFHNRHRTWLEPLADQRSPGSRLPLPLDRGVARLAAQRAADPALQQRLQTVLDDAAALGVDRCQRVVLLPATTSHAAAEPIPSSEPWLALLVTASGPDAELLSVLAQALGTVTRWSAVDSLSPMIAFRDAPWDRWERARHIRLAEWIYTEGLGLHLAAALLPELTPAQCLGVNATEFRRLRDRERTLRPLFDADLDQAGLGLVLRWLVPDAPASARTIGDVTIPRRAGAYLAWRMVADRVRRVGIAEAVRMASG